MVVDLVVNAVGVWNWVEGVNAITVFEGEVERQRKNPAMRALVPATVLNMILLFE